MSRRVDPFWFPAAIGRQRIQCSDMELVTIEPPAGLSCASFMARFISDSGGYLENPDASSACRFCSARTTDEWMGSSFNIFYKNHWRDFGLFWAYIVFNVSQFSFKAFRSGAHLAFIFQTCAVYALTYFARVRGHRRIGVIGKWAMKMIDKLKKSSWTSFLRMLLAWFDVFFANKQ